MLFNINATKQLAFFVCVSLTLCSTGCRSNRLGGMNMFGFNSQPSAEALAGNGPTTTYPAPPSESATPEAIASLAGGTIASPGQNSIATNSVAPSTQPYRGSTAFAGLDVNPGKVEPATATIPNTAASEANGFYGKTQPAGFSVPEMKTPQVQMPNMSASGKTGYNVATQNMPSPNTTAVSMPAPSGYQFGGNANTTSAGQDFAMPKAVSASIETDGARSNAFVVPDVAAVKTRLSDNPGMSLPGELANNVTASISDAKSAFNAKAETVAAKVADISLPNMQMSDVQIPNVQMPTVQMGGNLGTAQASVPAATVAAGTPSYSAAGDGYSPGSTSAATGYPSSGYANPSSSGSTYR